MDFNAYNMKMLAEETRNSQNQEKYKDIMNAIIEAAQTGKNCIDITDLPDGCVQWLSNLDFEVYVRRRDNRWIPADEKLYDIDEFPFPRIEKEHLYKIVW